MDWSTVHEFLNYIQVDLNEKLFSVCNWNWLTFIWLWFHFSNQTMLKAWINNGKSWEMILVEQRNRSFIVILWFGDK